MLSLFLSTPSVAQVAGGTISGTITDKSGALIADAQITIHDLATNVVKTTETNKQGIYSAPNLLPGNYEVTATARKFSTSVATGITLTVGAQIEINLSLGVGKAVERVEVTTAASSVDTSSSTISGVVNSETVRELPLNTRDWTQLATLQPGVSAIHTQVILSSGPDRGNRGFGSQLTITGGRPSQNNYRLDGVSINDYSNGAPGSVLGVNLGVDAVEEFSVLTGNYSAEYGRTSGGVINAITKSGTDKFHGDVYEFYRNSALDARNYFDPAQKAPFLKNQFGASAGGPIIRKKTFLFGDFEGVRQSTKQTTPISVPSPAARAGNFTTGTVPVDPVAGKYLAFFPQADPNTIQGDTGTATASPDQVTNETYFTIRADHALTHKDALAGTYVFDRANTSQPDLLNVILTANRTNRQIVTLQDSHTFSDKLLNSARFGYNAVFALAGQNQNAINPASTDTSLGVVPARPAPGIVFSDGAVITFPGGLGASPNYRFDWKTLQFYDDAFFTKGIHSIKFGFAYEHIIDNILASSDQNGVLTYATFSDFLSNGPVQNFNAALPGGITERRVRQNIIAGYIQDDVRALPAVTLNAGLRYEIATVPTELDGKLSTLRLPTDATPHLGSPFFANPTEKNFEPRVGFSWDVRGNGKTALRAGFGIFDVLPLPYLYELLLPLSAPFYQLGNVSNLNGGAFPGGLFSQIGGQSNLRQSYVQANPKRNYVMQWNANVQQELTSDLALMVAYVGSRGIHHAFRADEINVVQPLDPQSLTPTFPINGTTLNPNVGQISTVAWIGDSVYHALEVQLTKRVSHGLQGGVSYTFGKSIDSGSATVGGDSFANSISSLPFYNSRLRRGPSDFDVRQNLVLNYIWLLPTPKVSSSLLKAVAGGWQLGGEYQASSGIPFTPNIGGDPLGLGGADPYDFPDRLGGSGCHSLVNPGNVNHYIKTECLAAPNPLNRRGNLSRNALNGPRLQDVDMSFIKNNPVRRISDAFNVQLRVEMFNILNHANFAPPINHQTVFDGTGSPVQFAGLLDTTTTTSRQIQLGVKFIW